MSAGTTYAKILTALTLARTQQRISQEAVASHVGVSRQAIAAWEGAVNIPTADKLLRWADFLGMPLGVLS